MTSHFSISTNLSAIPRVSPKDLEAIMDILPSDYNVKITADNISRNVDYSSLENQIRKDNPFTEGLDFHSPSIVAFSQYIPREKLLEIYGSQYEWGEMLEGGRESVDKFTVEVDKTRLYVRNIGWSWTAPTPHDKEWSSKVGVDAIGVEIDVAPNAVYVKYMSSEEPSIVGKLREALKDSKAKVIAKPYQEGTLPITYTFVPVKD